MEIMLAEVLLLTSFMRATRESTFAQRTKVPTVKSTCLRLQTVLHIGLWAASTTRFGSIMETATQHIICIYLPELPRMVHLSREARLLAFPGTLGLQEVHICTLRCILTGC